MAGGGCAAAAALEVHAYAFCFIAFERAGVGLLLGHAHVIEDVENRPALYFKLSC
jgi:hypothetical protein